jgi:hypothetical protein
VYRARRPFDPMKLYRLIHGKFILLHEAEDEEDGDEDEDDDGEDGDQQNEFRCPQSGSDRSSPSANDSDKVTDDGEFGPPLDDPQILANKKADPHFSGLHRSKGLFWLATRPGQMGSWSTAGAMLTLGSEMPWFCCVSEEDWGADEDTLRAIKNDFEGAWGDRRQEMVFIGERLDVEGLTKKLDACLLSRAEMRKWEKVMNDKSLDNEEKEGKLAEMWDDSYWADWPRAEDEKGHDHEHEEHHHGHSHKY